MVHSRFGNALAHSLAAAFMLFLTMGSEAQQEMKTVPTPDELGSEIEQILKVDEKSPSSEEDSLKIFGRIEELVPRLAEVGDYETAGALARKGAGLFPEERRSLALLGWTEGLAGEYSRAIEITRSALEAPTINLPDPDEVSLKNAETSLAGFLLHEGEPREAVQLLEKAAQRVSAPPANQYLLGQAYFELGESFLAAKAYERALQEAPALADPEDYFRYATALDQMGKLDKAAKALQMGAQALPNASGLYLNLGLNAEATGATREAYLHYRMETEVSGPDSPFSAASEKRIERIEALQLNSSFPDAALQALIAYLQIREIREDPEKAEKDFDSKIEKAYSEVFSIEWSDHPYLRLLKADRLASINARDQAIAALDEARSQYPKQVLFTLELAKIYGEIGEASKSNELIRDALLEAPDHWMVERLVGPSNSPE